jgi:hypothetical protein
MEILDGFEMLRITGHQYQVVFDGGGGDDCVPGA